MTVPGQAHQKAEVDGRGHPLARWFLSVTAFVFMLVFPHTLLVNTDLWCYPSLHEPARAESQAPDWDGSLPRQEQRLEDHWELLPPELPTVHSSFEDLEWEEVFVPPRVRVEGGGPWLSMINEGTWGLVHRVYRHDRLVDETELAEATTTYLWRAHGRCSERMVALTFDDGPEPRNTPGILSILRQYDAKATFFVIGEYAERHPSLIQRIVDQGHELGNHTFTHTTTFQSTQQDFWGEMEETNRVLASITGSRPYWFRPNDMVINTCMMRAAEDLGHGVALWTIDSLDWKASCPQEIVEQVMTPLLAPGAVMLFHDGGGNRNALFQALPVIIETLMELGYELVTLSELHANTHFE